MVTKFFYLIFLFFLYESCLAQDIGQRGIWVVRGDIKNETELQNLLILSKKLKLTDWYLQIYALGERQDVDKELTNKIITIAHLEKIKVHAWANVFFIWQGDQRPAQISHPFYLAEQYLFDLPFDIKSSPYKKLRKNGEEGYFIDPGCLSYFNYFQDMTSEILNEYEFDGIHLDYFRYPSVESALSVANTTEFQQNHYVRPIYSDIQADSKQYHRRLIKSMQEMFNEQKNEKLESRMKEFSFFLRTQFPGLLFSVAVKADLDDAQKRFSQDWKSWNDKKYCDYVIVMNYTPDRSLYEKNNKTLLEFIDPARVQIGLAAYNQSTEEVSYRLKNINPEFSGWVLFSYKVISKNNQLTKTINQLLNN